MTAPRAPRSAGGSARYVRRPGPARQRRRPGARGSGGRGPSGSRGWPGPAPPAAGQSGWRRPGASPALHRDEDRGPAGVPCAWRQAQSGGGSGRGGGGCLRAARAAHVWAAGTGVEVPVCPCHRGCGEWPRCHWPGLAPRLCRALRCACCRSTLTVIISIFYIKSKGFVFRNVSLQSLLQVLVLSAAFAKRDLPVFPTA